MRNARYRLLLGSPLVVGVLAATISQVRPHAQGGGNPRPTADRGEALYQKHCVECHGVEGKGDGPAAPVLNPRPRDFSDGRYKIRSTETGSVPTDDDLTRSIRLGLPGSTMPAWDGILSDADVRMLVEYLKTLSPRFRSEPPRPIAATQPILASPESVQRGLAVYEKLQCGKCHGTDGRGTGASASSFQDDWGQPLAAADLTEPWTFRGGPTAGNIYMRFLSGMAGTPMPSFKDAASDVEMWDLANYVASLRRKPVWEMTADEVTAFYAQQDAQNKANPARRGAYLVETLGCVLCHSPMDENKRMLPGMRLAGGVRMRLTPWGDYTTGNLTSDKETGLGNWTDDEIRRVITRGTLRDGTRLLPFPMDWASFATMKDDDINAIIAYLRTVPPVRNRVPAPRRTMLPAYLWGKFQVLILGVDPPMSYYSGNAGSTTESGR